MSSMERTRIFISYRREDTAPYAGRIYDRLVTEFGFDQVFLDIDTIPPGDDFVEVLTEKVESCDVLLAVIGKAWLTIADAGGRPRIQNPGDFVAIEIGAALRRKVRVIPILVGGGRMPLSSELPEALTPLARRQAYDLQDKGFVSALEKLFPVLQKSRSAAAGAGLATSTVSAQPQVLKAGTKKINSTDGLTYIWIPPGSFMMGCSPGDKHCSEEEKPKHRVEISKGFWIGETPVTQEAYERVVGSNPSSIKMPQRPVECVTWEDAQRYCQLVGMRLPTEAEWEYAARAGSTATRYGKLDEIAWYDKNSRRETHDVRGKQPNAWGLYDMLGNVDEWVADRFDQTYYERSEVRDPEGPREGSLRLTRGGSSLNSSLSVSASRRFWREPVVPYDDVGFRCVGT